MSAVEIIVRLDVMLALRKMKSRDLAQAVGITEQNISLLKSGKVKGIRFETLAKICAVLQAKCEVPWEQVLTMLNKPLKLFSPFVWVPMPSSISCPSEWWVSFRPGIIPS